MHYTNQQGEKAWLLSCLTPQQSYLAHSTNESVVSVSNWFLQILWVLQHMLLLSYAVLVEP